MTDTSLGKMLRLLDGVKVLNPKQVGRFLCVFCFSTGRPTEHCFFVCRIFDKCMSYLSYELFLKNGHPGSVEALSELKLRISSIATSVLSPLGVEHKHDPFAPATTKYCCFFKYLKTHPLNFPTHPSLRVTQISGFGPTPGAFGPSPES